MKGPASGPVELWTLVNPPSDVSADGVSVFNDHGRLQTIDGMVHAVDAGTGEILWQRPAFDGIKGTIGTGQAFGTLTVGNGVVLHRLPGRQGNHGRAGCRLREEAVRVS